jgi:uncharacterized SAM-binding protein YcdF (DUF218 family)
MTILLYLLMTILFYLLMTILLYLLMTILLYLLITILFHPLMATQARAAERRAKQARAAQKKSVRATAEGEAENGSEPQGEIPAEAAVWLLQLLGKGAQEEGQQEAADKLLAAARCVLMGMTRGVDGVASRCGC